MFYLSCLFTFRLRVLYLEVGTTGGTTCSDPLTQDFLDSLTGSYPSGYAKLEELEELLMGLLEGPPPGNPDRLPQESDMGMSGSPVGGAPKISENPAPGDFFSSSSSSASFSTASTGDLGLTAGEGGAAGREGGGAGREGGGAGRAGGGAGRAGGGAGLAGGAVGLLGFSAGGAGLEGGGPRKNLILSNPLRHNIPCPKSLKHSVEIQ